MLIFTLILLTWIIAMIIYFIIIHKSPTKYRFRFYEKGWLTKNKIYKLEKKYFNLIWIEIKNGSVNNYFYEEELEGVKEKLKTGELYIKDFKLNGSFYIETEMDDFEV